MLFVCLITYLQRDLSLRIAIGFPDNPATYCETVFPAGGGLKLVARKSTPNILDALDHLFGQRNVAVNIVVTRFGVKERTRKYPSIDWKADSNLKKLQFYLNLSYF